MTVRHLLESFTPFGTAAETAVDAGSGTALSSQLNFSNAGLALTETLSVGGSTVETYGYGYDHLNQLAFVTEAHSETHSTFSYERGLLTAASGGTAGAFSYDESGNLIGKDGAEFSYGAHRLLTGTPATWASSATFAGRLTVYVPMGAAIGAASDTASQFASNLIDAAGDSPRSPRGQPRGSSARLLLPAARPLPADIP
ncbi:MAG: hypothetical protein ACLP22_20990 [Solirubrobacteraceae bacterium]